MCWKCVKSQTWKKRSTREKWKENKRTKFRDQERLEHSQQIAYVGKKVYLAKNTYLFLVFSQTLVFYYNNFLFGWCHAGFHLSVQQVGCAVVAGMLHFFYLSAFCWMCLEGIQLFRMVVLVFNTNFKTLYMMAGGYGVPAVIVAVSALVSHKEYGTDRQWVPQISHCISTIESYTA